MAQPIQKIVRPVKSEAELEAERLAEVRKETAADADGLIEALKLLQAMHDRGALELVAAIFQRGDRVLNILVDILAQPGATNALKNVIAVAEAFGQVDAESILKYGKGVSAGLANASKFAHAAESAASKPLGIVELVKQLKDPDVSAAVRVGLAFLKGFGQTVRQSEGKEGES
jgi:uncharacterized protein YjgD (DUF1641 family)